MILTVTGKTEDGSLVIAGVFRWYETIGLPLDVMFECFQKANMVPDWLTFYVEAVRAGMKHDRIISKLDSALVDVYGSDYRDTVISRLELITRGYNG